MSNQMYTDTKHLFINGDDKPEHTIESSELSNLMEDFLKKGGKITKLPSKYRRNSAVEEFKAEKKKRKRRKK